MLNNSKITFKIFTRKHHPFLQNLNLSQNTGIYFIRMFVSHSTYFCLYLFVVNEGECALAVLVLHVIKRVFVKFV